MKIEKSIRLIIFLVMGGLAFFCKNPFATREPEPPTQGRSSWQLPTDPSIVLQNMRVAIQEKNVENYMKCLVDSANIFRFIPDQYQATVNAGIFERWSLAHEQSYINKLFTSIPNDSLRALAFSNIQRNEFPDSALIRADYILEVHHQLGASYPTMAKGQASFIFIKRYGYWVIRRWIDFETQIDPSSSRVSSWSTIKANFI